MLNESVEPEKLPFFNFSKQLTFLWFAKEAIHASWVIGSLLDLAVFPATLKTGHLYSPAGLLSLLKSVRQIGAGLQ